MLSKRFFNALSQTKHAKYIKWANILNKGNLEGRMDTKNAHVVGTRVIMLTRRFVLNAVMEKVPRGTTNSEFFFLPDLNTYGETTSI